MRIEAVFPKTDVARFLTTRCITSGTVLGAWVAEHVHEELGFTEDLLSNALLLHLQFNCPLSSKELGGFGVDERVKESEKIIAIVGLYAFEGTAIVLPNCLKR
jgi:hypothetical protein